MKGEIKLNIVNIVSGYRIMLGMRQSDMAKLLSISRQSYWSKENGRTPFSDNEKILFKNEIIKIIPTITIDDIFFKNRVGK